MIFKFIQKTFGLDISERACRLIQLKKYRSKAKIISSGEIKVPEGVIQNGKIIKIDEFVHLIKKLIKDSRGQKISTRYVTACLPEPNSFIKLINLTYPESKNTLEEIINETKKHIPYPLEKTYLDWQYVDEKDKSKVLIAVCPKEIVDNYQESLTKAGLIPDTLEIEEVAICRSLIKFNTTAPDPFIILDLGATRTSLIAYQDQAVLFSLSLTFSSNSLTKNLINKLRLLPKEAEKAKRICGLDLNKAEGGVRKILETSVKQLARQIREAKYFYHEHVSKEKSINRIVLTGGGSQLPYLITYLGNKCQIKLEIANPLVNLIKPDKELLIKDIQSYSTAIGLALRNIQKK